ncbi:MAG: type II toxin-antitoxin system VapC family toxin [Gammaproteobacteria bacterium]|nr:type II toxin-antitoxin system VapC family toxin [Gammaproteobacteria bacterium]
MHLLDTNTLSYMLRGEGGVGARMLALKRDQVAVPAVVVYELRYGLKRLDSKKPSARALLQTAEILLAALRTVAFDEACAEAAATLRADLERAGTPLGPNDTLIAATALVTRSVLVTRNTREFGRVRGLEIEDWYDPKVPRVRTLLQEPAAPRKRRATAAARR